MSQLLKQEDQFRLIQDNDETRSGKSRKSVELQNNQITIKQNQGS